MDPVLIPSSGDGVRSDEKSSSSPDVRTTGPDTGVAELTMQHVFDLSQAKIDIMGRFMMDV